VTPKEAVDLAKKNNARIVDLKFMDLLGTWQHFSVPISELEEHLFEEGLGFDGSSVRGWQAINASDMLVVPDATTTVMDPFMEIPTVSMLCNIVDPITKEKYTRDPRNIAQKAEAYLQSTGIGDTAYFGPEAEFFIFDDVRYDLASNHSFYEVDSAEGSWNTGRDEGPNLGHKPRHKEGYFPVSPVDTFQDMRSEMLLLMEQVGMSMECHHHEVATGGQNEIAMRFSSLVKCADNLQWYKYIVKNVAKRHGKTATFMPKPLYGDNGTGMHVHQSIWKDGKPLFAGNGYAGFSETGLHYIGGILKHSRAICAFAAPTTNSYKRLVPGFEAPVNLAYSSRNRSAACRIPMYSPSPKAKRVEIRYPDPSSNGYLAFAVMLMAGLDGIANKIDPGEPLDKDIYALGPEELAEIPTLPHSLDDALNALEENHDFLLKGDVFTQDIIDQWIEYKRENEIAQLRLRPHPLEFHMYYDV
jgi:glutamine synthetase